MLTVHRKADPRLWTSELRCATGRSAIAHMLARIDAGHDLSSHVFMPCYVPEGVIEPIKRGGRPITFYKLNADLTPDLDDLYPMIKQAERPLVVVIHYFGFETPLMADLSVLLHRHGGLLFEDCAHAFWCRAEHADIALWSLNKVMPTVDGAILKARNGIDVSLDVYNGLPREAVEAYRWHLKLNMDVLMSSVSGDRHMAADIMVKSDGWYERYYAIIKELLHPCRMTQEAEMVLGRQALHEREGEIRDTRCLWYNHELSDEFCLHKRLRPDMSAGSKPHGPVFAYPIVCPDYPPRTAIAMEIGKVGVAPATLVTKWDHIPLKGFDNERNFMRRHLLLPVDASVGVENVCRVGEVLRSLKMEKVA